MKTIDRAVVVVAILATASIAPAQTKPQKSPAGSVAAAGMAPHVRVATIAPRPEDVGSVDGMIKAWYAVVNVAPGEAPDWARDRTLYMPGLRFVDVGTRNGKPFPTITTHQEYVDRSDASMRKGFFENEIHRVTESFGPITHVWSTYESRRTPDGPVTARGINSIELYWDGSRWWIANAIWANESEGNSIPAQYLPPAK
jgi:hypothetical protein